MHEGRGIGSLDPSHYKLYIHLAEDDLLSGYPESRSFFILQASSNRGTTWMRRLWKMEYCYSTLGFRQLCKST